MVSKEVEAKAKGVKAFATYSPTHLKVKLQQKQWGPKWEEKDGAS
jgi:hypothetical protein